MRKFDLVVKSCCPAECPANIKKESHGPCDSYYWNECSISNDREIKFSSFDNGFPDFCPLKKIEVKK